MRRKIYLQLNILRWFKTKKVLEKKCGNAYLGLRPAMKLEDSLETSGRDLFQFWDSHNRTDILGHWSL